MTTSTDVYDLSARNFIAQCHPVTAFMTAGELIVHLAEHDESFRGKVKELKQQIGQGDLHSSLLALFEDALIQEDPFKTGWASGALMPLIGAFYLRASAGLQENGLPTDEELVESICDRERFHRLKSSLEHGFLLKCGTYANRSYHRVEAFRLEIDGAIEDLRSVWATFERQASRLDELFLGSEPEPQQAVCIFNGQRINCVVFWILVISILLVALIIDIFD